MMKTVAAALFAAALMPPHIASAAASTSDGRVSVAQVMEMVEYAARDEKVRQIVIAYLAGIGETAGELVRRKALNCARPITVSGDAAFAAVSAVSDRRRWAETAATPLVVEDLLKRAGCR